jgi:hypothetical protein
MRTKWLLWLLLPSLMACTREADRIFVVSQGCLYTRSPVVSKTQIRLGQSVTFSLPTEATRLARIEILPTKVSFLVEDRVVGEDTTQPYTFVWTAKAGDLGIPTTGSVDLPVFARTSFVDPKCDATVRSDKFLTLIVTEPAPQP